VYTKLAGTVKRAFPKLRAKNCAPKIARQNLRNKIAKQTNKKYLGTN
jgi:hypothetical protein